MAAMLLAWPGAIAIGVSLGLLGSGGSILTVPVLVYLVGQEEKVAIAGSLAIVGVIAVVGSIPSVRARLVDWRSVVLFGVPGMAGTWLGAWGSAYVSGAVQLAVFAVVMIAAAAFMLRPDPRMSATPVAPGAVVGGTVSVRPPAHGSERGPERRPAAGIAVEGLVVGAVTGFVGVGGGFLIVPALVLLGGLDMHRAVATSLVIIALKSGVGLVKYLEVLHQEGLALDPGIIALVAGLGIAGSLVGNRMARRVPQASLRRVFGVFLVLMGAFILTGSLPDALEAFAAERGNS